MNKIYIKRNHDRLKKMYRVYQNNGVEFDKTTPAERSLREALRADKTQQVPCRQNNEAIYKLLTAYQSVGGTPGQ